MKHLYMIGGPMGVGKTAVCRALSAQLDKSVFLDGDWCWAMHPFIVNEETKAMVTGNIVHLLSSFLRCREFKHVIFCWVMHEQAIIDGILQKLPLADCQVHTISLVCSEDVLKQRLQKDIDAGIRTEDVIDRSLGRLAMYEKLNTAKIDTTLMSIDDVVQAMIRSAKPDTVNLRRAGAEHAELIWQMQVEAFSESHEKYQDTQTNPAAETPEKVLSRLMQPFTYYYLIEYGGNIAGAIRIVDRKEPDARKRISPLFILPSYRKLGIAQGAIREAERIHGNENWALETILEEPSLCRLYEKMGYCKTGKMQRINDLLTLVYYQK